MNRKQFPWEGSVQFYGGVAAFPLSNLIATTAGGQGQFGSGANIMMKPFKIIMLTNHISLWLSLSLLFPLPLSRSLCLYTVHPLVQVPNQLVGAPVLTDVTLICNVEASPKAINYWQRENGKFNPFTPPFTPLHSPVSRSIFHSFFLRFFPPGFSLGFSFFRHLVYKPFNAAICLYLVRVRSWNTFGFDFQLHLTYIANVTAQVDPPQLPPHPP